MRLVRSARFHVQLSVSFGEPGSVGELLECEGRVLRAFRGSDALRVGDAVTCALPVVRTLEDVATGAYCWMPYEKLRAAEAIEVFLDGEPPELEVADCGWFLTLLAHATDEPSIPQDLPEEALIRRVLGDSRRGE